MNGLARFVVLFAYFQLNRLVVKATEFDSERGSIDSTTSSISSSFSSVRDSLKGHISDIDEEIFENHDQIEEVKLDLSDINLDLFTVKDDYYRGYSSKVIQLKEPKVNVKIVDGNITIHEHVINEKFLQCTLNSNKNYTYIKYDYMGGRSRIYSVIYYKRNGEWIVTDEDLISELEKGDLESSGLSDNCSDYDKCGPRYSKSIDELYIRFDLDINTRGENENVDFRECYIQDIHSLVYIIKNGYRVNKITQGDNKVCDVENGEKCFYILVLMEENYPKLIMTLNNKSDEIVKHFFMKISDTWTKISKEEYYNQSLQMKEKSEKKEDIELDIRTRNDSSQVLFIDSDFDNIHTQIFTPKLGYSFKNIRIKDYLIWERKKSECQIVLVRFHNNYPFYIHLIMPKGVSDEFYYMKKKFIKEILRKIKRTKYEGTWNKIDERRYSSGIVPLKMSPPINLKSNKFVLDINSKANNDIYMYRNWFPFGLENYIYMAKDGYKISMVQENEKKIWRSKNGEFGSFVLVVLKGQEPNLVDVVSFDKDIESKHYYFEKFEGIWSEITQADFIDKRNELANLSSGSNKEDNIPYKDVDLNISDKKKFVFIQYDFDGMDTIILIPNKDNKVGRVLYKGKVIWKRKDEDCAMIITRLNDGEPYFVNIVKPGNKSEEFFYISPLKENLFETNKWKRVEFDHMKAQITNFRLKPYIQHSYKEYKLDITKDIRDGKCSFKCGDFYNIPSCYYITKSGHAITKLVEGDKVLWRSRNGEYAPYAIILYKDNYPKLIFLLVNKSTMEINETRSIYFKRKKDGWIPVYDDKEFIYKLNQMEVIAKNLEEFKLDINQRKDNEKVVFFEDELGVRNIILYFPNRDYRLVQLNEGEQVIWKTDAQNHMVSVKCYLINDKPYLIRVRYRHRKIQFKDFEKVGSKWVEIDSLTYLVKILTLNDVFFSELNVIKSSLFNKTVMEIGSDTSERSEESREGDSLKGSNKLTGTSERENYKEEIQFDLIDREPSITSVESVFNAIGAKEESQSLSSVGDIFDESMENYTSSVLNIIDINFNSFKFSDNIYKNYLHRAVEVNYGHKVTKVVEGKLPIHELKSDENLFRCIIYHKEGIPELVDIFIQDRNKRLTYYIYSKREGEWVMTYVKRSDLMYRLYKYLSRPIKKYVKLELENKDEEDFEWEEKTFTRYLYAAISPKPERSVTKVTYQGNVIHRLRKTQTLTWAFIYKMEDDQEVLDLFVVEYDGRLNCYVYKRDSEGWKLDYSKESDETNPVDSAANRFKEFVKHKMIDTCEEEPLEHREQEEVVLNLNQQKPSFEYTIEEVGCKMFRPKKYEKVIKLMEEEEDIFEIPEYKSLLASFLYEKNEEKLALYIFTVDYDGNVERTKYYKVSGKWESEEDLKSENRIDEIETEYEMDKVTNEEVLEYLNSSFNCKFKEDWEDSGSVKSSEETVRRKSIIWILDLSEVDMSKFKVTNSTIDGKECREVSPNEYVYVDRVMDGDHIVYDLQPGETFLRSTVCLEENDEFNIECEVVSIDGEVNKYSMRTSDSASTDSSDSESSYTRVTSKKSENLYSTAGSHVINIANLNSENCEIENSFFRGNLIKRFKIKPFLRITRTFEGVRLINIARKGERIIGGTIYYNNGPKMLALRSTSPHKNFDQYLYYKVDHEWMLVENYEISKYLRRVYSDGKYVTDQEVDELIGDREVGVEENVDFL